MAFTKPNDPAAGVNPATYAPQAAPDKVDWDIIVAGSSGTGVVSGCAVTAHGGGAMAVDVASGVITVAAGAQVTVSAASNLTVTAADLTNPRIDLVVVNSSGVVSVTAGAAAATPCMPNVPASSVALAEVYVPATQASVIAGMLRDLRVVQSASYGPTRYELKRDFAAVGDGVIVSDGAITSGTNTLACATSVPFLAGSVGKSIMVAGAGAAGANLLTTISGFTNTGHVTLTANASTTVSAAYVAFGTDDTAAIQSAVTTMAAAGTALCGVSDGIYILAAAVTVGTKLSAQVLIPAVTDTAVANSLGFVGKSAPFGMPQSVQVGGSNAPCDTGGAVFCSLQSAPAGTAPSVLGADGPAAGITHSKTVVVLDGLSVLCPPNNNIAAVNLLRAGGCLIGRALGVRVGVLSNLPIAAQPPSGNTNSMGLVGPEVGNWAKCAYGTLDVSGFTFLWIPNEHTVADAVNLSYGTYGIQLNQGYGGVRVSHLATYSLVHHIVANCTTQPLPLSLGEWFIENDGLSSPTSPSWAATTDHLNAAINASSVLLGNVGLLVMADQGGGLVSRDLTRSSGTINFQVLGQASAAVGLQPPPGAELAYAEVTAGDLTTTNVGLASRVDAAGLLISFVATARPVSIEVMLPQVFNTTVNDGVGVQIVQNIAGNGNNTPLLQQGQMISGGIASAGEVIRISVRLAAGTLTAGTTYTFKVMFNATVGGTATLSNTSGKPMSIRAVQA